MASIYVLTFEGTVDMDDIVIFTTFESGIECLKKSYDRRYLAEFKCLGKNPNALLLYATYTCDKDGIITTELY